MISSHRKAALKRIAIIIFPAIIVIGVVFWTAFVHNNYVSQPIPFNHKLHIQDVGLECSDCHKYTERLSRAGIPNLAECGDCHSEQNGETQAEAAVVRHVQEEVPIPWRHVNHLPNHIYFSHLRHVKIGRMECSRCHGPMEDLERPQRKPYVSLSMSWCMDCHEKQGITNDCLFCHR